MKLSLRWSHQTGWWLALALFVLGSAAAWTLGAALNARRDARVQDEFLQLSERVANDLQRRTQQAVFGLKALRGFYVASDQVSADEFNTFTQVGNLQAEFAGLRGFAWIDRVPRSDLAAYEQAVRLQGPADFRVHSLGDDRAAHLFVVRLIEPATDNPGALGLDVGSEPLRRAAIEQAIVSGEATMSAPLHLLQDPRGGAGVLVVLPVYRENDWLKSADERRSMLRGLVDAPIILSELLEGIETYVSGTVHIELRDIAPGLANQGLLYRSAAEPHGQFEHTSQFRLLGRLLQLRTRGTALFDQDNNTSIGLIVGAGGTWVSLLLALLLGQQVRARSTAERLAQRLNSDVQRLARVAQHTSNLVIITDTAQRIEWVNAAFERITGYSAAEVLGRTPALLQTEQTDRHTLDTLAATLRAGLAFNGELLNRSKAGRNYWIALEIQPLRDAAGTLSGYMAIESDITEARAARERLDTATRENDALLHTLDLFAIVSVANAQGRILRANDAFCTLSGYALDDLLGRTHHMLNSGLHDAAFWQTMWQKISIGMPWRGEVCNRRPDGSLYWVDTFIAPFIDNEGRIDRFVAIRIDITDKKAAQDQARRAAELLQSAIDAMDDGFALFDEQDQLVLFNQRYRETYTQSRTHIAAGVTFESILRAGVQSGQYADLPANSEDWIAQRLQAHRQKHSQVLQKLADGRTLRITERRMANGHTLGSRVDVTDLIAASEAAQEASKSKSQFLANMSHELRTPMNAVLGMLTLLRKTPLDAKQLDYAAKAETASQSLLALLNDILDLSKAEAGKVTLDPQPTLLRQLLDDLRVIVQAYIGAKPVSLLLRAAPDLPDAVRVDALRLKQVLINLCSNAVKFTEKGEVEVSIDALDITRDLAVLKFAVRDQGIGIAPEQQTRIFEGFHQAEASITRRFGGTGLGLAISQRLVRLMGGRLELQSALGHGSRFYFTISLPIAPLGQVAPASAPMPLASAAAPTAQSSAASPPLAGMVLLLAEDNLVNQQIALELLQSEGAEIDVANNGQEALDRVAAAPDRYHLVLMDMQMPVMDGLTATRELRRSHDAQRLPIVAMTANAMDSDRAACLQAGMNDHVGKPFNLRHLVVTLRRLTGREA